MRLEPIPTTNRPARRAEAFPVARRKAEAVAEGLALGLNWRDPLAEVLADDDAETLDSLAYRPAWAGLI